MTHIENYTTKQPYQGALENAKKKKMYKYLSELPLKVCFLRQFSAIFQTLLALKFSGINAHKTAHTLIKPLFKT